jgi:pimeloyl-ACP methyl ester carboxylesterase
MQAQNTETMELDWQGVPVYAEKSAPIRSQEDSSSTQPSVVLLHGLGGSNLYWSKILETLPQQGYSAIALDLPGHGQSGLPSDQSLTPKWMGQALANWLKTQPSQQSFLVGHSLGGWVALQAYLHDPTAVQGLILIASAGLEGVNFAPPQMSLGGDFSTMMQQLFGTLFHDPSKIDQTELQSILTQAMSAPALMSLSPEGMLKSSDLETINCPSLLIWGENDKLIPSEWAQVFHDHLPNSQLSYISECGHLPQLEKPSEVHNSLTQFLGSI